MMQNAWNRSLCINIGQTEYKEKLKKLVLRNLAEVHWIVLSDQYMDMHI
jgi:hypothetical protein